MRLVSGLGPADLARRADNLAHGFRAMLCRVRSARSGAVVLEFVRRDALAAIIACAVLVLMTWRWFWPSGFARWVAMPARNTWRARVYRRRWPAVMTIADLAPFYRGRIILPVLVKVTSTRYVDRVAVRLVSGQCAADFAARADNLAHGFRALLCRVRTARSGAVVLEFVRRDALAQVVEPAPIAPPIRMPGGPPTRPPTSMPPAVPPPVSHWSRRS